MAFAVLLAACGGVKQAKKDMLLLKQGTLDTLPNKVVEIKEAKIQKDDILSITVFSDNPEASAIYNLQTSAQPNTSQASATTGSGKTLGGYLVDKQGNIRMQTIGIIKAEGLTRMELMDTVAERLQPYLKNPYADVRFLNSRVTIIGEVQKPGTYSLPDDKMSVLELLGFAGDFTIYAKRENLLVIREENGKREFGRLDMRRADVFQSPFFYLQNNDKVVVEPISKKPTATEQENLKKLTLITTFATLASTLSILISIFR
jgi:polysaccharide export outer membrane protein